ncbi:MAG: hypothetical protein U5K00_10660 [Melioribacteraceae bacterium]|nr:hypothetical protein [Melioribacteraceae bacterium]
MKHYVSKIGFKLILAVGITTLIIISVYAYFTIQSQQNVLTTEVERHGNQLSEALKKVCIMKCSQITVRAFTT